MENKPKQLTLPEMEKVKEQAKSGWKTYTYVLPNGRVRTVSAKSPPEKK